MKTLDKLMVITSLSEHIVLIATQITKKYLIIDILILMIAIVNKFIDRAICTKCFLNL